MVLVGSLVVVIGLLVLSAVLFLLFAAKTKQRRLFDDEYTFEGSREIGPEEQGAEAVLDQRLLRGEIDPETYQQQMDDLHRRTAA